MLVFYHEEIAKPCPQLPWCISKITLAHLVNLLYIYTGTNKRDY